MSDALNPTKVSTIATTIVIVRKANEKKLTKPERRAIFNFDFIMILPKVRRADNITTIIKPAGIIVMVLVRTGVAVAKPETTRTSMRTAIAVEQ